MFVTNFVDGKIGEGGDVTEKEIRPNLRNWAEVKQKRRKLDPTWPTIFVTPKNIFVFYRELISNLKHVTKR